jgi:hypothetical protein
MKVFLDRGYLRVYVTHHILMQLPAACRKFLLYGSCGMLQSHEGTVYNFVHVGWKQQLLQLLDFLPRRFPLILER